MHYRRFTSLALLFSLALAFTVNAQQDAPRRLRRPLEVLSLDHSQQQSTIARTAGQAFDETGIVADTKLPQVDNEGRVRGAKVADRLRSMRRRSVDVDLSRSFFAEPSTQTVQHQGELPAVPKRRAGKPVPEKETPSEVVGQIEEATAPVPTPAKQNVPSPAVSQSPVTQSSIPTRPMATQPIVPTAPKIKAHVPIATAPAEPMVAPPVAEESVVVEPKVVEEPYVGEMVLPAIEAATTTTNMTTTPAQAPHKNETLLLKNRAPAITFETLGPRKIVIGQETTYQVRMINMGDVPAENVLVTVKMPSWAEVNSSSASRGTPLADSSNESMSSVTWDLSKLDSRGTETLTLGIVPRDSRPIELAVGWAFNPEQATAQIEVQEPMLKMDISGPADVNFGETATFSITLSNPGTGDAENVVLNLMPSTQQRVTGSREIGTLKMGERKTIDIELTAHQAGRLQVRAMAHAVGDLRDEASKDVVVRRANLEMALLGPPRNYAASGATYKVRVENTGDAVAEEVTAIATLPAGAAFLGATDSGRFTKERGQVEWVIGAMQPGTSRVLELQCELHSSGENRMDVHCDAARDISIAKSVVTHVEALADLKLYVNDPKGAIAVGESSTYEVRIENRGTKAAEMIQLIGYFSDGIEPMAVRGAKGELATGQVVMDPIPMIEPGQSIVFQISARASKPGNHVFRAELQCSLPETRLASEEWTKFYSAAGGGEIRQAMVPAEFETDASGGTFQIETR